MCYNKNKKKGVIVMPRYTRANYNGTKGDGISYPEKVGRALFYLVDGNVVYQYSPKWANNKKYDFYLPKYNMIIELHGEQHYKPKGFMGDQTENDIYKRELAKNNNITYYYEIDCSSTLFSYIKNNITTIKEIDWSNIDWDNVAKNAELDIVKLVCDFKREHNDYNIKQLAEEFQISTHAVRTYVRKGADLGWCEYNFRELQYTETKKREKGKGNPNPGKTVLVYKDGVLVGRYDSLPECCNDKTNGLQIKFSASKVSLVCNGKSKQHKGYTFKYEE